MSYVMAGGMLLNVGAGIFGRHQQRKQQKKQHRELECFKTN
tara:strand:- start:134 stop:256 length:123 start_codon:yes stop_codon:yes gene_type:complete